MKASKSLLKAACLFLYIICCQDLLAHNGKIAHAYPLGPIIIDGNFSDWPATAVRYAIDTRLSDTRPTDNTDFSGFFQVGYRLDNRSLYIAFTITDADFIEDTTKDVRFDTQDCLELCLDARHIAGQSGVASFMYSKKLRNINKAFFDPFAKNASWDMMEVAMLRRGNTRYYEWRIILGEQMAVNKSVGFDFAIFDKDPDQSFSIYGWGEGGSKFMNPKGLGDILLLPAKEKLSTVTGQFNRVKEPGRKIPGQLRLTSIDKPGLWMQLKVDSLFNYSADIPAGKYRINFPDEYIYIDDKLYSVESSVIPVVTVKPGEKSIVPGITVFNSPQPDLIPAKGVLHEFDPRRPDQLDRFIETYQKYYQIPGVSLALIKDGKMVYHKTYGVRNVMTGAKVGDTTLFEAASITKPVFAFAVQRLAERGVIDLDKPIYLYLPFKDIEHDERYKLITARHVLTHRTGFPNWRSMNEGGKLDIKFTPGTNFGYSGEGFEYLKLVIEKITGKKVEQVLQEEVIEPTGLYHTFFSRNDSLRRMVAEGHYDLLPTYDELPGSPGMAYSMHTEGRIFTRFMIYLLEQKGLTTQSYETMFRKHSDYNYDPGEKKPAVHTYMGMSFEIRETPFGKSFGHGGNNGDFKCLFEVYKDLKMGYVIFTNSNTSDPLLRAIGQFLIEGAQKTP